MPLITYDLCVSLLPASLEKKKKTEHNEEVQSGSYHAVHFRLISYRLLNDKYVLAGDKPPHITVRVL